MTTNMDVQRQKILTMIKNEIKVALNGYVTKDDLKAASRDYGIAIDRVIDYIDYRLEPVDEFMREFREFKDQMLKSMDFLVGAYQKLTDEHTVAFEQYSRLDGKLEDYEVRIKLLENKRRKKPS